MPPSKVSACAQLSPGHHVILNLFALLSGNYVTEKHEMECCKRQRVHYDLSLALYFFRGVGRESEVPLSIFSAGGGGGETS